MIWLQFFISAALVVVAAIKLVEYGDVIAVRTRLGGMFVGTLLLAGATSLPEFLTILNALDQNVPNLAAGNLFGSSMFNMLLLAVLDLSNHQARILRRVAMRHALTASLATLLTGMVIFFMLADVDVQAGWVGLDSLLVMGAYLVGVRIIQTGLAVPVVAPSVTVEDTVDDATLPSLRRAGLGFLLAAGALVIVTPWLVSSSATIAEVTGLGASFIGTTLVAVITSLPELVTVLSASRLGAYDLAVGNLFGSNAFNIFALALTDVFYLRGRFLGDIDPTFALAGLLGLLLTNLGLIGNLARVERRLWFIEVDALFIIVGYMAGLWLLYNQGIGL